MPPGLAVVLSVALSSPTPLPLVSNRAPDTTSLAAIVSSVTRGCQTDDERAIAIYNYLRYALYHHAYPGENGSIGSAKLLNVYGWSLCGGEHTVLAALYEKAGFPWRYRGWSDPGHTTVEAQYGGRWHYLDVFLKFLTWRQDPSFPGGWTVASQEDIVAQPALLDELALDPDRQVVVQRDGGDAWTAPAFLVCGDDLAGVLQGCRHSNNAGSPRGWGGIAFDEPGYDPIPKLGPGWSLQLDWAKVVGGAIGDDKLPAHSCGDKDYRWCPVVGPLLEPYWVQDKAQSWSNGSATFAPELSRRECLDAFAQTDNCAWADGALRPAQAGRPASVTLRCELPYPTVRLQASQGLTVQVSADGKAWGPAERARGLYAWSARLSFAEPLRRLQLTAVVQHNQRALPYLAPGRNVLTLGGDQPTSARCALTIAYQPGSRDRTEQRLLDKGEELGRGHHAEWAPPVVVRTVVDKLPATLQIDVPTPKGREPVYPRMLWIRREILAPGQSPAATPVPPATPKVGANETLAELPNPWTLGNQPPVPRPAGATDEVRLKFASRSIATGDGKLWDNGTLRWPKHAAEQVIPCAWLLGRPLGDLPPADRIVSARIEFAVTDAHDKAPTQVAAVALKSPLVAGQVYDLAGLGATVGTTILKQAEQPAPFTPALRYSLDVTRAVKALVRDGGAGFALRVLPNRSVDDGWTVRFTPDPATAPELVLSVARPKA